jgi:hypothetical protein
MRLRNRHFIPWLFLAIVVVGAASIFLFSHNDKQIELLLTLVGGTAGVAGFLYSQHLQETALFKQLFTEFNERYDHMNQRLLEVRTVALADEGALTHEQLLVDYFNLCSEEFLFYEAGYIDEKVWRSWCRGMLQFALVPAIRALWEHELKTRSYYGFSLKRIEEDGAKDGT